MLCFAPGLVSVALHLGPTVIGWGVYEGTVDIVSVCI